MYSGARIYIFKFVAYFGTYACMCMTVCMYVCMYEYMYACILVHIYLCMFACMHVCMNVCSHICVYICTYICMYVCMYVCIYACIFVRMYVCMYACIHTFYVAFMQCAVSSNTCALICACMKHACVHAYMIWYTANPFLFTILLATPSPHLFMCVFLVCVCLSCRSLFVCVCICMGVRIRMLCVHVYVWCDCVRGVWEHSIIAQERPLLSEASWKPRSQVAERRRDRQRKRERNVGYQDVGYQLCGIPTPWDRKRDSFVGQKERHRGIESETPSPLTHLSCTYTHTHTRFILKRAHDPYILAPAPPFSPSLSPPSHTMHCSLIRTHTDKHGA